MSIPHDPLCGVFSMARGFCDMDCAKRQGDASWKHPPGRALSTHLGDGEGEALLAGAPDLSAFLTPANSAPSVPTHHEREDVIARLVAHHENAFAQLAMDQARLLRDELPDRVTMDALNRMMGRHASILAELRR